MGLFRLCFEFWKRFCFACGALTIQTIDPRKASRWQVLGLESIAFYILTVEHLPVFPLRTADFTALIIDYFVHWW